MHAGFTRASENLPGGTRPEAQAFQPDVWGSLFCSHDHN
jgi:hypothetical protein